MPLFRKFKIPIDINTGLIVLRNVKITGPDKTRKVDLYLDTGSTFTSLPADLLEQIGYNLELVKKERIFVADGSMESPLLTVKCFSLGLIAKDNIKTLCVNLPPEAEA